PLAVTHHLDRDLASDGRLRYGAGQAGDAGDETAVVPGDGGTLLEAHAGGRGIVRDTADERAVGVGQAEAGGQVLRDGLDRPAQPGARHVTALGELGDDRLDQVGRDREPDADGAAV